MKLLKELKSLFESEKEELEVKPENIPEQFLEERKEKIKKARKQKKELLNQSKDIINNLKNSLEEIKDFKDDEDLQVVEDVSRNFYNTRENLVENLELSDNFVQHVKDFKDFVDEFNDVSRKEGVVMKRIEKQSGKLLSCIEDMTDHTEKLDEFQKNQYSLVLKLEEYRGKTEELKNLEEKIEKKESQVKEHNKSDENKEISEVEEKIMELTESEEKKRVEKLESRVDSLQSKKEDKESEINRDLSKTERGFRKAIYEIKNSGKEFSGEVSTLEKLVDHEYRQVDQLESLNEVLDIIKEETLLDDRQLEKFKEGLQGVQKLEKRIQEIDVLHEEIEEIQEQIEKKEITEKIESRKEELDELKKDRVEIEEKIEDLKDDLDGLEEKLEEKKEFLRSSLEEELGRPVKLDD